VRWKSFHWRRIVSPSLTVWFEVQLSIRDDCAAVGDQRADAEQHDRRIVSGRRLRSRA